MLGVKPLSVSLLVTDGEPDAAATAQASAALVMWRSYSRPARRRASIAITRKKTPTMEPANIPLERLCHDEDRKHVSTVYQFQSIETGVRGAWWREREGWDGRLAKGALLRLSTSASVIAG